MKQMSMKQMSIMKRETLPEEYIPYIRYINQHVVALNSRCLMVVMAVEGVNFDTVDIDQLNSLHNQLNTLLKISQMNGLLYILTSSAAVKRFTQKVIFFHLLQQH